MAQLTSLARTTIIVSWLMVGLAFLSTIMHVAWLSRFKKGNIDASDICIWLAFVFGIILVAQTTWAVVDEGSGRHQWDIAQQNISAVAKSLIVSETLWCVCGALIRVSGCCTVKRIIGPVKKLRHFMVAVLCLCIAHGIVSILEVCFICRPITAQWDPNATGLCGNQILSFAALEVSALVLDLAILLAPLPVLISSKLSKAKKLRIVLVLDAGCLLLIVTALRLKALHLASSTDYTYSKSYLGLLSSIGCMLGVVFCNLIALPTTITSAMEAFQKLAVLQKLGWKMEKQLGAISIALQVVFTKKDKTSAGQSNVHEISKFSSSTLSQPQCELPSGIDEDLDEDEETRVYEHGTVRFSPLESNV